MFMKKNWIGWLWKYSLVVKADRLQFSFALLCTAVHWSTFLLHCCRAGSCCLSSSVIFVCERVQNGSVSCLSVFNILSSDDKHEIVFSTIIIHFKNHLYCKFYVLWPETYENSITRKEKLSSFQLELSIKQCWCYQCREVIQNSADS